MVEKPRHEAEKLQKLIEVMLEMTDASSVTSLWDLLYQGARLLVDASHVVITRLDDSTGDLKVVKSDNDEQQSLTLKIGQGITGYALEQEQIIRVDDVRTAEWSRVYAEFWVDTRSEIALPILVNRVPVRVGREVHIGTKALGVLNLESDRLGAFSPEDKERLQLLVRHAAILIERRESDEKLKQLRQIERQISAEKDTDVIINKIIFKGIQEILRFEFINVSLVNIAKNSIDTKYITGMPQPEMREFKQMACHSLDSEDIQAHIVRTRQIEVPEANDPRFDPSIFNRFHHQNIIRVFLPMIEFSSGSVLGTVEASYRRSYRKFIYERDVQILENFADHIIQALERDKSGMIDRIMHELKSPIVGIRSNVEFLQRRLHQLGQERIDIKLSDILTDCEMLLYQVGSLEYVFSGRRRERRMTIKRFYVFRDVVLKTFNQLRPIISEMGFRHSAFQYNSQDSRRITVSSDPVKLNQVVYNLLINSIKYAETDPSAFQILIDVSEDKEHFTIQFKDWGIGINEQYKDEIFKQGFRTPEAIRKNVTGSGLGLAISRAIMHELGGDLRLVHYSKPTEIHMIIPKDFKGA